MRRCSNDRPIVVIMGLLSEERVVRELVPSFIEGRRCIELISGSIIGSRINTIIYNIYTTIKRNYKNYLHLYVYIIIN